jgi:hypothetical protein
MNSASSAASWSVTCRLDANFFLLSGAELVAALRRTGVERHSRMMAKFGSSLKLIDLRSNLCVIAMATVRSACWLEKD